MVTVVKTLAEVAVIVVVGIEGDETVLTLEVAVLAMGVALIFVCCVASSVLAAAVGE